MGIRTKEEARAAAAEWAENCHIGIGWDPARISACADMIAALVLLADRLPSEAPQETLPPNEPESAPEGAYTITVLPWEGGKRPVADAQMVMARLRSGVWGFGTAFHYRWDHAGSPGDIVAYAVLPSGL